MDGMLSQEEINALLNGMTSDIESLQENDELHEALTDQEKDAIGEISNISMGTAATALSTLVNQKVVITTPVVSSYATWEDLANDYDKPCVFIQISYKDGLDGNNILILKESDVKIITDLMMGGDGTNISDDLSELHLSAIGEAMNQMMGSASTSISSMLERKVDISPPTASVVDLNDSLEQGMNLPFLNSAFVKVAFKMQIGDLVDSELMQLYPFDFARDLYSKFSTISGPSNVSEQKPQPKQESTMNQQSQPTPQVVDDQAMQYQTTPNMGAQMNQAQQIPYNTQMAQPMNMQMAQPMNMQMAQPYGMPMQDVNVQPAQFQAFNQMVNLESNQENIGLIMDVPLEVTVELGRSSKSIKEFLEFAPGTIIELDKLAGEPVDVLVNGKFVAKGEVVVIEESFGIRVTEIIR